MGGRHGRPLGGFLLHHLIERGERLVGVERVAGEVEAGDPPPLRLPFECRGEWRRLRRVEHIGPVMVGQSLLGPLGRHAPDGRGLGRWIPGPLGRF
jgi:hypothetical protein